eukprot:1244277-Pyramimonas_sp.AAC.1
MDAALWLLSFCVAVLRVLEIDCVDSNTAKEGSAGSRANDPDEPPFLESELLHRLPPFRMAHVEPPTWVNSRIGGTRQFFEPLCSMTWVW